MNRFTMGANMGTMTTQNDESSRRVEVSKDMREHLPDAPCRFVRIMSFLDIPSGTDR
jgi:hypothetical protein